MSHNLMTPLVSRRSLLQRSAVGFGSLALASMLADESAGAAVGDPLAARLPLVAARAKRIIFLLMSGGPSQVDTFDHKPLLDRDDGKPLPFPKPRVQFNSTKNLLRSPWKFRQHGECGTPLSELLPGLSQVVDDILVIRSMHTGVNNHGQSIHAMNTGRTQRGRPALGSWLTFGLGADTDELPAYVAMTDPRGLPVEGVLNWSNGWLPSLFQGTVVRPREPRILNLEPPEQLRGQVQSNYLDLLTRLNQQHAQKRPGDLELEARITNFRLAARMQTAAREALDVSRETRATHQLYGLDNPVTVEFGTRCLIARRLVERGVAFVEVSLGQTSGGVGWDTHQNNFTSLKNNRMPPVDRAIPQLLLDRPQLRRRAARHPRRLRGLAPPPRAPPASGARARGRSRLARGSPTT